MTNSNRPIAVTHALEGYTEDAPVRFNLESWVKWLAPVPVLDAAMASITGYLGKRPTIDRGEVSRKVHECLQNDDVLGAFLWTMIWGHGPTGRGPWRTRRILCSADSAHFDPSVVERLGASIAPIVTQQSDGDFIFSSVEAFRRLNNYAEGVNEGARIKNLGPAFFTKWIHFASSRGERNPRFAAPILDSVMVKAINDLHPQTKILRGDWTADYEKYFRLLESWGGDSFSATQVEEAIFLSVQSK